MRLFWKGPLIAALAISCRGYESEEPPVHLVQNMDTQEKGKAYREDTTGLFANGRMMQAPVAGTVARGHLKDDPLLHYGKNAEGKASKLFPARFKTGGQVKASVRARGKGRYNIYCAPCHGTAGDGKGPVAMPALDGGKRLQVAPPSFHDQRLKDLFVGVIYEAIYKGVNEGNMPSYAAQIPVDDRWAIVAHVRELQRSKDPSVQDEGGKAPIVVAEITEASAEVGGQLYQAKACVGCHSLDGTKMPGPTFQGIWGRVEKLTTGEQVKVDEAYVRESILKPKAKIVEGYAPLMPNIPLTELEVDSLVLYIKSVGQGEK